MTLDKALLQSCMDGLTEPLFVLSADRKLLFGNKAFYSLVGAITNTESIHDFWPKAVTHRVIEGDFTTELLRISIQPSLIDSSCIYEKILVKMYGTVLNGIGTLLKVVAAQSSSDSKGLYHAQRLETLGMLAGAVAHDFNNVLTGILGHTTYLKAILPQSGPHIESLNAIEEGTKKGASITQQVLSFSKLDTFQSATEVSLQELITKTMLLVRKAIPTTLKIETNFKCGITKVLAVEGQLAQVLVNLLMNARDAISGTGTIEISLSIESNHDVLSNVFGGSDIAKDRFAVLSVSDTGTGIPVENLKRIFEPYFTTKREKGTGLGLSTVLGIIHGLGGQVTIQSELGRGSTLNLYIPVHSVEESHIISPKAEQRIQRGTERILIVDDEYPVRNVLAVSLQHLGYKVTSCDSAFEALRIIDSEGLKYELIISDMLMPGMSGDEFFFALKEKYAEFKFLIISGFSSQDSIQRMLEHGADGFLPKPFTIEELASRVREVFDL